ncbi:MAG: ImmA/IrrE family metallo-endopeptidase [Reyranella sp.]|uniref:ImmA/IrrE family metallo-endopeptidase n=1 Tax=Reyranella sp. TaxID=1929291 RepID=UPI00121CF33C|nr:ImmA/IrrE family metallo-endopeptidase [Reyranella sp.]TAJ39011.1 MAG: ImmA/IrrE family metallo-endopeptidase [Reyranella sp.]
MIKPDDSSLDPDELRAVEERARKLLDRASAWKVFPTPVDDIVAAAKLKLAPSSLFDPRRLMAYIQEKTAGTANLVKSAISKIFGLCDVEESVIHIDSTVAQSKQNFLKLHETGHHELPTHRKLFKFFQDCDKTLAPETADRFEREANNFARFALFQGDTYRQYAADSKFTIKTPMNLAKKFGASVYASTREFARTNFRECVVYILEPIEFAPGVGARAHVRRVEVSPSYAIKFGYPADTVITLDHMLGPVLPIGRRMTRPTTLFVADRNGDRHECLAEAFDTTWNILVLLYPVKALTASTVILPSGFKEVAAT